MKTDTLMLMCWQWVWEATFKLRILLMQHACVWLGKSAGFSAATAVSFSHYSLTHLPAASVPSSLPSTLPACFHPSPPPSLSHWPLPAHSSQGKLPQLRNTVLLHCTVLLSSASLHPYSTHANAHIHTYFQRALSHTSMHHAVLHTKTPPRSHGSV